MKVNHSTAEQIIKILEQAERGEQTVGAVCREHGLAEATFYHWRKTYGGMSVAEAHRLKEFEKENGRSNVCSPSACLKSTYSRRYAPKKVNGR